MFNHVVFGDSQKMTELDDESIDLVVCSPPYYNSELDFPEFYSSYQVFLETMRNIVHETKRVLREGRVVAYVVDDVLIDGERFPIVADMTRILSEAFRYRDRIVWQKPDGFVRISRRSGVLIQHPYPLYFYPDNLHETILVFQKNRFDYKSVPREVKDASKIDLKEFLDGKWFHSIWRIVNVLPNSNGFQKGTAAFPEELVRRLVKLYSFAGDVVLDPFAGGCTTLKVASCLGRNAVGYELDLGLLEIVKKRLANQQDPAGHPVDFKLTIREDAKNMRTGLQEKIEARRRQPSRTRCRRAVIAEPARYWTG